MASLHRTPAALLALACVSHIGAAWPCDKHRPSEDFIASAIAAAPEAAKTAKGHPPGLPWPTREVVLLRQADGELIDKEEFIIARPDDCTADHWHAADGESVFTLEGTEVPDPDIPKCGYGTSLSMKSRVFQVLVTSSDADFDGLIDALDGSPNNADANNDGVPDGNADSDFDGLTDAREILVTFTNPLMADSDGKGFNDDIDFFIETAERDFTTIPVVANLYLGSGSTARHARDAIAQANIILKKLRLQFVLVATHEGVSEGDDGSGGGIPQDGRFTESELAGVMSNGLAETLGLPTTKGFKVSFAAPGGVWAAQPTTPGLSLHRLGSVVCEQRASASLTGATIAHELLHVLTLDHPPVGSPEHTPGNIMTPSNGGRDAFVSSSDADKGIENVSVTEEQWFTVETDGIARQLGVVSTRNSPARKREYESGVAVDARADRAGGQPSHLDLVHAQAASDESRDSLHLVLTLASQLPTTGTPLAVYRILFDADNSAATGSTIQGTAGIDVEAQVLMTRHPELGQDVILRRFRYPGPTRRPMFPFAEVRPVALRADSSTFIPAVKADLFELWLKKSELGLTADSVPVRIIAQATEAGPMVDDLSFVYDRKRWQKDPTMALTQEFVAPGQTVPFTLSGLMPNGTVSLRIDDVELMTATLDNNGAYAGSFVAPAALPHAFRFLTAQDGSGTFAVSGVLVTTAVFADGFEAGP